MADRPSRRRSQQGAAAIEFVLIMPVLLVLMAGTITLGLATYAKYRLADSTMVASRQCALQAGVNCSAAVNAAFASRWANAASVCAGGVQTIGVSSASSIVSVQSRCNFIGGVMQQYLGMPQIELNASAATPF